MKHLLLWLLLAALVGSMPDTMCFQEGAVGTYARPVLNRTETETERACRVACGDDPECTSVSYDQPTCLLLGAPNTSLKCSNPVATLPLKKPTGCNVRTNLTGNYGNDPCVIKIVPDVLRLDRSPICPRNANNYIIRAIDEFGNRVTLDNDINNIMTFNAARNMWKFFFPNTGFTKWVVSASCATADDACCNTVSLNPILPPMFGATGVQNGGNGACADSTMQLSTFSGKANDSTTSKTYSAAESATMTITCQAGIWLLSNLDGTNGWHITNATCAP